MEEKDLKGRYEAPWAEVRGVFLCENVADTVFSPARRVDAKQWVDGGETTAAEGGDVFIAI
jgi:hypothetical protein